MNDIKSTLRTTRALEFAHVSFVLFLHVTSEDIA